MYQLGHDNAGILMPGDDPKLTCLLYTRQAASTKPAKRHRIMPVIERHRQKISKFGEKKSSLTFAILPESKNAPKLP
jgi:hypothetical protein